MPKLKKIPKPNKTYELRPERRKHDCKILSLDPGSRNMGISVVGVVGDRIDVIANSILTNPITSLVDNYMTRRQVFIDEIKLWMTMYEPKAVATERFQMRGTGSGGPLIELVSNMSAVVSMIDPSLPSKFIVASQWKNAFNRRFGNVLEDMYKEVRTTPHQLDAILIGAYCLELGLRRQLVYTPEGIIKLAEATSMLPLKRERK